MIVAMLVCQNTEQDPSNPAQGNFYMTGVTDTEGEYKQFFAYTPYADLRMGVLNPSAFEQIEPGKTYRMTLEKVD
jgi:hypothetical protein